MKTDRLTPKQRRFVDAYLSDACGNATAAAVLAGYSEHTASQAGYENLRKPEIREEIDARLNAEGMRTAEVLARLARVARGDVNGTPAKPIEALMALQTLARMIPPAPAERPPYLVSLSPERSNLSIAAEMGVDDHTVRSVRETASEIPMLSTVLGADGKVYTYHPDEEEEPATAVEFVAESEPGILDYPAMLHVRLDPHSPLERPCPAEPS